MISVLKRTPIPNVNPEKESCLVALDEGAILIVVCLFVLGNRIKHRPPVAPHQGHQVAILSARPFRHCRPAALPAALPTTAPTVIRAVTSTEALRLPVPLTQPAKRRRVNDRRP